METVGIAPAGVVQESAGGQDAVAYVAQRLFRQRGSGVMVKTFDQVIRRFDRELAV